MPETVTSPGERALRELLTGARLTPTDAMGELAARALRHLGVTDFTLFVVDHAQVALVPLWPEGGERLSVEATLPGRVFRTVEMLDVPADGGGRRVWLPLLDSIERAGVLGVTVPEVYETLLARLGAFSGALAEILVSKAAYSDTIARAARLERMSLAAEMQWGLMPPLTGGTDAVVVAAMLEPCYDVGGDVVDYALDDSLAQFAIFDAMGHGLEASVIASIVVGAYRNARRSGKDLGSTAAFIDAALMAQFGGDRFATALLAELDVASGRLRWINAGHPPPLLLRGRHVVKHLGGGNPSAPPLGLDLLPAPLTVLEESLEPGDRLLAYTDGVVEARDAEGRQFGLDRLVEVVVQGEAAGLQAPETMRRLSQAVLGHQAELRDDATHLLVEWRGDRAQSLLIP